MDSIFKKGDYIYFRVKEDDEENSRKAGDIIRYSKEYILSETLNYFDSDYFNTDSVLEEGLNDEEFIKRIFSEQTLLRDYRTSINKEDVDPSTLEKLVSYKDRDLLAKLLGIEDNDRITFAFEKGNVVDLSNPILSRLFFSSRFNNILQETELITDPLKEELFNEDFENAICVTPVEYCDFSFEKPSEHHYYKIKDEIKAQDPFELAKLLNIPYFGPFNYDTIKDEAGFIKYVAVINSYEDKTSRVNEQKLLQISEVVPREEALRIHEEACQKYLREQQERRDAFNRRIEEEERELNESFQEVKDDPTLFPGTNGKFIHIDGEASEKKEYSLEEIKTFFKRLKDLDSDVVKNICFYGGTIPYVLTDSNESRAFGDIDMFVPTECMEALRKEFQKQSSFEMICDSKPLAEECVLSTRIPKGEDFVERELTEDCLESSNYDRGHDDEYIDAEGFVHNQRNVKEEKELPYYRKVQDFGFKANLFGVNISVFPIYEYNNDIMAKSFNINDMYNILLGVRVINNTALDDFVREIHLYDSTFKVLPLEFTLVSKQSALDGKYINRSDKDKKDIEYILEHKDELGISDERLEKIKENYPDYSISIAYKVDGKYTTTMGGETYKKLVLTNMHVS